MYQALMADEDAFTRLSGFRIVEFEALYGIFDATWKVMESERLNYAGRQAAPGAGRKFVVDRRDQLLSVLLWSNLQLHPQDLSCLLDVHISTFARIRQRVLAVLARLDVAIDMPNRTNYKGISQLAEAYPELLCLV